MALCIIVITLGDTLRPFPGDFSIGALMALTSLASIITRPSSFRIGGGASPVMTDFDAFGPAFPVKVVKMCHTPRWRSTSVSMILICAAVGERRALQVSISGYKLSFAERTPHHPTIGTRHTRKIDLVVIR